MLQNRVRQTRGYPQVFEIDGVNFVRHGGRADFTRDGFLFEMVQRHVTPDIAVKVDQDSVETGDAVEQLSNVVVRLNLRGVRVPLDAQRGDKLFAELMPVNFRVSGDVGVIVTDCTIDLTKNFNWLS